MAAGIIEAIKEGVFSVSVVSGSCGSGGGIAGVCKVWLVWLVLGVILTVATRDEVITCPAFTAFGASNGRTNKAGGRGCKVGSVDSRGGCPSSATTGVGAFDISGSILNDPYCVTYDKGTCSGGNGLIYSSVRIRR